MSKCIVQYLGLSNYCKLKNISVTNQQRISEAKRVRDAVLNWEVGGNSLSRWKRVNTPSMEDSDSHRLETTLSSKADIIPLLLRIRVNLL